MSEPIKVGDLVQAIRGHECVLGFTFTVASIHGQQGGGWKCDRCGLIDLAPEEKYGASQDYGTHAIPLGWLKRIQPLAELEGEKHEEEIHA